jgi:hypothetical protein
MSGYKRPTNGEFNIHLAKRMADRKASNVERSQANVDAIRLREGVQQESWRVQQAPTSGGRGPS